MLLLWIESDTDLDQGSILLCPLANCSVDIFILGVSCRYTQFFTCPLWKPDLVFSECHLHSPGF